MRALIKALIIAIITVGVVVPAGYFSFIVYHETSVSMTQLIPADSSMVLRVDYNGTPIYAYNSSNNDGAVIGLSLANFDAELSATSNQSNGTHTYVQPELYSTYRGYSIYVVSNVTLKGIIPQNITTVALGYDYTVNVSKYIKDGTFYIVDVSSVISLGSLEAVKMSIDALVDKVNFEAMAAKYFNNTANVSAYFISSDTPLKMGFSNVYYLSTDFNLQFTNATASEGVYRALGAASLLPTNYTYFHALEIQGTWVNGTLAIGVGNYYLLEDLAQTLASLNLNYTELFPGFKL